MLESFCAWRCGRLFLCFCCKNSEELLKQYFNKIQCTIAFKIEEPTDTDYIFTSIEKWKTLLVYNKKFTIFIFIYF